MRLSAKLKAILVAFKDKHDSPGGDPVIWVETKESWQNKVYAVSFGVKNLWSNPLQKTVSIIVSYDEWGCDEGRGEISINGHEMCIDDQDIIIDYLRSTIEEYEQANKDWFVSNVG